MIDFIIFFCNGIELAWGVGGSDAEEFMRDRK
jgi:hypothetical protein